MQQRARARSTGRGAPARATTKAATIEPAVGELAPVRDGQDEAGEHEEERGGDVAAVRAASRPSAARARTAACRSASEDVEASQRARAGQRLDAVLTTSPPRGCEHARRNLQERAVRRARATASASSRTTTGSTPAPARARSRGPRRDEGYDCVPGASSRRALRGNTTRGPACAGGPPARAGRRRGASCRPDRRGPCCSRR